MMAGPFQRLPGSSEGWTVGDPWLLPIDDDGISAATASEGADAAVRRATRPLWIAANGLGLALALLFATGSGLGWMGGHAVPPVAKVPVVATASAS